MRAQKWPHEPVGFAGKRVIGTGSTGIQIVQTLGRQAGELFVFQRTPSYTLPMRNHDLKPDYVAEMKRHYPAMREAMRNKADRRHASRLDPSVLQPAAIAAPPGDGAGLGEWRPLIPRFLCGPDDQPGSQRSGRRLRARKDRRIVQDPVTAEALKPRGYPIFARRPCLDTDYYEIFNRPNVHLVDCLKAPIVEITEKGVRTEAGETELDILIIFATGYDALTGALLAFDVVGRNGLTLREKWKSGPVSYLGFMVAGFPSLFAPSGPNGPAALANLITIAEHDVDWIARVIEHMEENGLTSIEATAAVEAGWMKLVAQFAGEISSTSSAATR